MRKIKKGDDVIVICGKNKGQHGVVLSLSQDKVVVEGINNVKKQQKPNPAKGIVGGIIDQAMPLHISNVAILNPITKKADRVGFKWVEADGKKVRLFKSNSEFIGS